MTLRIRVAPDGASLLMFCDVCGENQLDLGEYPSAEEVAYVVGRVHLRCARSYPQLPSAPDDGGPA